MGTSRKPLTLAFIAVLAASFLMVEVASAVQPIPNPSPPQFTVYLVNAPYEVPATTPVVTVDPYTGEQKQVTPGTASYTADNVTIQLWILNEQSSYSNGTTNFTPYFNVRTKGHYEENWTQIGYTFQGRYTLESEDKRTYFYDYQTPQVGYKYTVVTLSATVPPQHDSSYINYPANATLDFQVRAAIGHQATLILSRSNLLKIPYESEGTALDAQSDWSQTQSITINSNNTVLASTLDNPSKPASIPIPLPTDTPQPTNTPTTTAPQTPTPTTTPNTKNTNFDYSADLLTLLIPAIALPTAVILTLLYVRKKKNK